MRQGYRGEVEEASENDRLLGGKAEPKTSYRALLDDEQIGSDNGSVWTCFGCLPGLGDCLLTADEKLVLEGLKRRVNTPYDEGNETHEQLLFRYWALAFPNEPKANSSSPRWKKLGFQSNNPRTDFRGGGVFALRNMVYFVEHYKADFHRMLSEANSQQMEYPFAAALINVSQMAVLYLKLNEEPGRVMGAGEDTASNRELKAFARLASDANAPVLEELFCACAMKLHSAWKAVCSRPNSTLMNFPEALRATKDAMKEVLSSRPESTSEFARISGGGRGGLANAV